MFNPKNLAQLDQESSLIREELVTYFKNEKFFESLMNELTRRIDKNAKEHISRMSLERVMNASDDDLVDMMKGELERSVLLLAIVGFNSVMVESENEV
jgi:hypothetical protein